MSQSVPPRHEGEITNPNPLELFWEKNKRLVTFALVAVLAAMAANYGWKYYQRKQVDELWSGFAVASGLDRGYSERGELYDLWAANFTRNPQALGYYLGTTQDELVSDLIEDLEKVDVTDLESELKRVAGTPAEPLAIWVLASRAVIDQEWEAARARLDELEKRFPDHFLVAETSYPVQWRKPVEKEEDPDVPPPRKPEKPELGPIVEGSAVGLMRARIAREQTFRAEHSELYEPRPPDSEETAVLELESSSLGDLGTVKIKFFTSAAPEHTRRIIELLKEEERFWDGLRVHELQRAPEGGNPFGAPPSELHFGLPKTKETDDSAQWTPGDVDEKNIVSWEETDLSHFPGTIAVEAHTEGKSQVERIVINGDDVAADKDGTRVIVGRIVEGLDVIQEIIDETLFASEGESQTGRGKPADLITIKSFKLEGQ